MLKDFIQKRIDDARSVFSNETTLDATRIEQLAKLIHETFESGHKIAFVGNGGSAAEAMHLAAEFTGKCVIEHKPLPALCLNESQSALTAIGNDYGIEFVFSRQVEAHLIAGDLLIALSTSGKSKNVLNALKSAEDLGVHSILWMGNFEIEIEEVDVWKVPSTSTPRIQEIHLVWGHILAECVEKILFELDSNSVSSE
jgi:D-sedoheptulose 7-phosphate isomerase